MSVHRSSGFPFGRRGLAAAGAVVCVVVGIVAALRSRANVEDPASALDVGPLAFEAHGAGRNIDDPCFWAHPRDPGESLLFVTAKDSRVVEVFRAATGARVGEIAGFTRPNNCTVEGDLLLTTDVGVPEVTMHHLPDLEIVGSFGADMLSPQGIDVLSTPEGQSLVYVTDSSDASVHVYDLDGGAPVRTFATGFGAGIEPILADDRYQRIFVARGEKEEARGIGLFTPEGTLVREFGGAIFSADTEGLGIYACGAGGYLLAADQNRSATEIEIFERESLTHIGTFRLRNAAGAATRATDGIALLQAPLPGYASGLLAVCDGCGSTPRDEMDVVGWDRVAAVMGLERCPGGGAPDCTTAPCARRLVAAADAFVTHEAPLTNFGKAATLEVERKPGQIMETLLRFEVPDLAGAEVLGARLRLTVDPRKGADSAGGGRLFRTSDKWSEEEVTFAKRPAAVGAVVSMIGRVRRDEPVDVDVSKVVGGPGRYDFLLVANSKDRVRYRSREAADSPPTLLLTLRARTEAAAPPVGEADSPPADAVADVSAVEAATGP
ncbi:MAG: phytase [Deltaproteobacteria bacterium]|nr:phytase [Deltaproteobacteria bacterium]